MNLLLTFAYSYKGWPDYLAELTECQEGGYAGRAKVFKLY